MNNTGQYFKFLLHRFSIEIQIVAFMKMLVKIYRLLVNLTTSSNSFAFGGQGIVLRGSRAFDELSEGDNLNY